MEEDRIKGFETGADDAFTYQLGNMVFSYAELVLKNKEEIVALTQREADLLRFRCEHPKKVIKREEVLLHVWGKLDYFLGRSMDVFMVKLRKYLKNIQAVSIETIHGIGFRFNINS